MNNTITLANGSAFTGSILPNIDNLVIFVYLTQTTMAEGFAAFSVPENVARITETIDPQNENVYEGYTTLVSINNEYGNCNIMLRRPVNAT